jgi:hypothetical protein
MKNYQKLFGLLWALQVLAPRALADDQTILLDQKALKQFVGSWRILETQPPRDVDDLQEKSRVKISALKGENELRSKIVGLTFAAYGGDAAIFDVPLVTKFLRELITIPAAGRQILSTTEMTATLKTTELDDEITTIKVSSEVKSFSQTLKPAKGPNTHTDTKIYNLELTPGTSTLVIDYEFVEYSKVRQTRRVLGHCELVKAAQK